MARLPDLDHLERGRWPRHHPHAVYEAEKMLDGFRRCVEAIFRDAGREAGGAVSPPWREIRRIAQAPQEPRKSSSRARTGPAANIRQLWIVSAFTSRCADATSKCPVRAMLFSVPPSIHVDLAQKLQDAVCAVRAHGDIQQPFARNLPRSRPEVRHPGHRCRARLTSTCDSCGEFDFV